MNPFGRKILARSTANRANLTDINQELTVSHSLGIHEFGDTVTFVLRVRERDLNTRVVTPIKHGIREDAHQGDICSDTWILRRSVVHENVITLVPTSDQRLLGASLSRLSPSDQTMT